MNIPKLKEIIVKGECPVCKRYGLTVTTFGDGWHAYTFEGNENFGGYQPSGFDVEYMRTAQVFCRFAGCPYKTRRFKYTQEIADLIRGRDAE